MVDNIGQFVCGIKNTWAEKNWRSINNNGTREKTFSNANVNFTFIDGEEYFRSIDNKALSESLFVGSNVNKSNEKLI